jgi:hypothetical protein
MSIESADNILHVKNSTMRISRVEVGQTLSVGNIEFENTTTLTSVTSNGNNTTPYTISSSNVTTGLATTANVIVGGELTVSGNTTVTGDLNVSGALGILDTIYPVGTVIDRATAITDTHLNGKYKAFLAAPNQEWELTKSPSTTVAFRADNNTSATYAAYTQHAFQVTKFNIGNCFANNVFTAPSDGQYVFGLHLNTYEDSSMINGLRKKAVGESTFTYIQDMMQPQGNSSENYSELSKSMILTLDEGDQIDVSGRTALNVNNMNGDDTVSLSHYIFWGFKVGGSTDNYKYKRTL